MLVTDRLTIGQLTFVLRAIIQILTYGGAFLITYVILASSPRVASLKTHDVINRVLGKSTATKGSALWILNGVRGKNTDPVLPTRLLVAIALSLLLGIFSSLSDIGFLGFYACSVPGPPTQDHPSSITNEALATSAIQASLVNGTDPNKVKAYRCDYAEPVQISANVSERICRSWHNSTFGDPSFFTGLNTTDSDILMPRQIRKYPYTRAQYLDLNSYFIGPSNTRVEEPVISSGIAVVPHDQGLRALFGVPQLKPQTKVDFEGAMLLEVEMGCMALGMYTQRNLDSPGAGGTDLFSTNETMWRKYYGPESLRSVLSKTVDDVREYYRPLFNTSSMDSDGFMFGYNSSTSLLSATASIRSIPFSNVGNRTDRAERGLEILGNCTEAIRQQFGIKTLEADTRTQPNMCNVLAIGGSLTSGGALYEGLSRMVCAATTQLNLVSATVEADSAGKINITSVDRLPSDLNTVIASFFDPIPQANGDTAYYDYEPAERYTLAPNPSGSTAHYIPARQLYSNIRGVGPASGGGVISRAASSMLNLGGSYDTDLDYAGLSVLNGGTKQAAFNASVVTTWGGQVGASFILASTGLNGWVALNANPIAVESTGGVVATCYKAPYVLGFVPLLLASVFIILWTVLLMASGFSIFKYAKSLEGLYSGMMPFWGVVCPTVKAQDAFLMWENAPSGPHLALVRNGAPNESGMRSKTAVDFLRDESSQSYVNAKESQES
ncbi:hypothetical protein V5O48_002134 [Marasmius crinis-equi]|uniref:Uncharacterized protein n=1 Tax=Marasmius crinis-equi TaxID=585013 RepID=A0ABR3FWI4_9AGAR